MTGQRVPYLPPYELLNRVAARYPSHRQLALRLKVTPSHVSRLLKGSTGLGPEACIRLADLLKEDRADILAALGHRELSRYFRPLPPPALPSAEPWQVDYEQLPEHDQRLVQALTHTLADLRARLRTTSSTADAGVRKGGAS